MFYVLEASTMGLVVIAEVNTIEKAKQVKSDCEDKGQMADYFITKLVMGDEY